MQFIHILIPPIILFDNHAEYTDSNIHLWEETRNEWKHIVTIYSNSSWESYPITIAVIYIIAASNAIDLWINVQLQFYTTLIHHEGLMN